MVKLLEPQTISEITENTKGCKITGNTNVVKYCEYKVIITFLNMGESITDLLSAGCFAKILRDCENGSTMAATGKE